jgi:4-carboxymuconolactone decarboxylase
MTTNDALDKRLRSLTRIAAAISIGAAPDMLHSTTVAGVSAGATEEQIVGTLFTAAPVVGSARLMAAAPVIARAVGYDIDQAFETLDR